MAMLIVLAILFVSIVWVHRPDLSVWDILREMIKELKSGKENQ